VLLLLSIVKRHVRLAPSVAAYSLATCQSSQSQ